MKSDPTFWLLARASGLTAYVLLTGSVLAGLTLKSRPLGRARQGGGGRSTSTASSPSSGWGCSACTRRRSCSTARCTSRRRRCSSPGSRRTGPLAVACGVLAAELMALIALSFPLRKRIGMRNWRRLHWATYAVFALGTVHGLTAGTDSSQPWAFDLYLGAVGAVAFATAYRVLARPQRPPSFEKGARDVPRS